MKTVSALRKRLDLGEKKRTWTYQFKHAGKSPVEKAIEWIKNNRIPGQGVPPYHRVRFATPEVTGYVIPTLYDYGEKELAREFVRWEMSVQRADGAVCAPATDVPYTFDTAQLIRGFLAVLDDMPEVEANLRRACDYVASHIAADGNVLHDTYEAWYLPDGTMLSEQGNLYVLPPLVDAAHRLSEPRYEEAARRGMEYFRRQADLVEWKPGLGTLSHYWGYMMEALVDLGERDLAQRGLDQARAIQRENGMIPAWPGVDWVCSTGMAQLSIAWYKLGEKEPADKAMAFLETIQRPTGGFYASQGEGAAYLPGQEIAWGVKFFLDASLWRAKCAFDHDAGMHGTFWEQIDEHDGRVQEILSAFGDLGRKSVLDVGCGKGRYLRALMAKHPGASFHGLDLSETMLASCPEGAQTKCGTLLNIGYPDASFDCVYSVEALEHAMLVPNALREMARVLKPGGKIIIIDKNVNQRGRLEIMPWEQWFKPGRLTRMIQAYGVEAHYKPVAYDHHTQPDGLFFALEGTKHA